jgi:predicted CXXCH cytochrome family protein
VDEATCVSCHAAEHKAWTGSHHDRAMQQATPETVLGDFDNATFKHHSVTTRFSKRGGKFVILTDGPDGKPAEFEVKYVFGVEPLQQYLLELPGGRLQGFTAAWDTKAKRWFHLYPHERIDFRDELHWTKPAQNWNHMCAECHVTNLKKNYDAAARTYNTSWQREDVGCQACHGPGSRHVEWAHAPKGTPATDRAAIKATFDVDLAANDSKVQIESCARCHSRRSVISGEYRYGQRLMDHYLPALLTDGLYYADRPQLDEVYNYGSFIQSRMHAKGVRCTDCHDPHSSKLKSQGNAVCTACHNATGAAARKHVDTSGLQKKDYDSPSHHFHKKGAAGSACVDCHAPAKNYMVVDPRHDHSFRIPRPDLMAEIGTPNACNSCHAKESAGWAAEAVTKWYGADRSKENHYGQTLAAGRQGKPGAAASLRALIDSPAQPAIVRATALELLQRYPGTAAAALTVRAIGDPDPLVRRAAVVALAGFPQTERVRLAAPLLADPVRAVRIEAAHVLAAVPEQSLGEPRLAAFRSALAEFEAVQRANADRPESWLALGNVYAARGQPQKAEDAYRAAIGLDDRFVPAYANLANLLRDGGNEAAAESMLREGMAATRNHAALEYALALSLVRQGNKPTALALLARAAKQAPGDIRIQYTYAVALHGAGKRSEAVKRLEALAPRANGDREVLLALAAFKREVGDFAGAERYLRELAAINSEDPALTTRKPEAVR